MEKKNNKKKLQTEIIAENSLENVSGGNAIDRERYVMDREEKAVEPLKPKERTPLSTLNKAGINKLLKEE